MSKLEPDDFFFLKKKDGEVIISRVDHIKKRVVVDLKNHINLDVDIIVATDGSEYDEMNEGPILKVKDFRDIISDQKISVFMKENSDKNKIANNLVKSQDEIDQEEQDELIKKLLLRNKGI
jgi:hypothetical protein